ncbi:MAG: hypothetical protein ACLFR2_03365 [Candidatus Kapaibacterium sp.]
MKFLTYSIIAIAAVLMMSCAGGTQNYGFMESVINNPEKLPEYIEQHPRELGLYQKIYMGEDTAEDDYPESLINEIKQKFTGEYQIYCDRTYIEYNDYYQNRVHTHEITYAGPDDSWLLQFKWVLSMARWRLYNIRFTSEFDCDKRYDFE